MRGEELFSYGAKLFLALCLLMLLSPAAAATDALYDEWHNTGDTFTKEGETYLVTHYRLDDESVILRVNTNSYVIKEGGCKSSMTRKYCVAYIDRDTNSDSEDSHVKYVAGTAYAGIHIIIATLGPEITITREFSASSPELNQEVDAVITIENEGEYAADDFVYKETFPDNVEVTDYASGFSLSGNTLTHQTSLLPIFSQRTLFYSFKIKNYTGFTSKGYSTYEYAGAKLSVNTSSAAFSINKPYDFTFSISPTSIEAGDDSALSLRVENKESGSINVSLLELRIPSQVTVSSLPGGLEKDGEKYRWNGTIASSGFKQITMLLKTKQDGDYSITAKLSLIDSKSKNFSENKTATLKATYKEISLIISVKEPVVTESGSYRVALSFENLNAKIIMRNIKGNVTSSLFNHMPFSLDELGPGQTKTVLVNDTLQAPFVDEKKIYDINFGGIYDLSFGKRLNFSKKMTLTVTPSNETLSIAQSADKKTVAAGANVTVTVRIKGNTQESYIVDSQDTVPGDLSILGGATSAKLSFDKSEEKQAYIYTLGVPEAHGEGVITITTSASIPGKGYSIMKSFNITVTPAPGKEANATVAPTENKAEEAAAPEPEKKKGFFTKVIDAVGDFFSRLLGKKK